MSVDMNVFQGFSQQIQKMGQMDVPSQHTDEERVSIAKQVMLEKMDSHLAVDLDACVHCGLCAEACHFYLATKDPKYTPIRKLDLMRRLYKRERGPFAWLYRMISKDISMDELEEWQELVFDSCTVCQRCSLICPMGIHVAAGVAGMRAAMRAADLMPVEMRLVGQEQGERGTLFGVGPDEFMEAINELRASGMEVPIDKPQADILVLSAVTSILLFKDTLTSTIKIMNQIGANWTFASHGFESANFGYMAGDEKWQCAASGKIYDAAVACGAKTVVVAECGHAYPALRWDGAELFGKPLPFEVMAPSQFLAREIKAGRLKVKKVNPPMKVSFHDPCKHARIGGIEEEPRYVLKALGVEYYEADPNGVENLCCGGGAGNFLINRAMPLRAQVFQLKMQQYDATPADTIVTSCDSCQMNFMAGSMVNQWDKPIEALVALVGANLA